MKTTLQCPNQNIKTTKIQLAHGGGGRLTHNLISEVFYPSFSNSLLDEQHDGAVFDCGDRRMAYTTDSFVVDPIFFNGGSIGDLAVNGTVNDLACCGAKPLFLTAAFIIEEGLPISDLKLVASDMEKAAAKAGVKIVTGDTKVVERGKCDKLFINTSGIGLVDNNVRIHADQIRVGDAIIVSGNIGEHGICILSTRENLGFESEVASDTAPLNIITLELMRSVPVHLFRDPTRGGLSSTLNEIAEQAKIRIDIEEKQLPLSKPVLAACDILGLDPLYVANEGIVLIFLEEQYVKQALNILRKSHTGRNACRIGTVKSYDNSGKVILNTSLGGHRVVDMLSGEQLPRIC